jgi:exodeoxyribonuclease-3
VKLLSWNVNGIRAAERGGFLNWFADEGADVVCIQETKAQPTQLAPELLNPLGYHGIWHSAQKKGYSGVATFSKREPVAVQVGLGRKDFDAEGRVLITEFPEVVVVNAYFPNSQRDHARLPDKLRFCRSILRKLNRLRRAGKDVLLCGDYNIAHREIDLANPKGNLRNAGFLPEERAWMDRFLRHGWIDTFRAFCDEPGHYTWWSYRPTIRERNIGWRIDYWCCNPELRGRLKRSYHQPQVHGSDHCPIGIELRR